MIITKYDNFYHHNRNYGCRFHKIIYKGYEALIIENEKIRTVVLVGKGTDIIEFLYKPEDIDFMWRSPLVLDGDNKNPITKEHKTGAFLDVYEGGWQEMFPSVNDPTNYKNTDLGFHGEIMFLPWDYEVITDSPYEVKIKFYVRLNRTPFMVEKYITIKSQQSFLEFDAEIINEGDEEFKFMWGQHPAIGKPFLDENCVIDVSRSATGLTYEVDFSGNSIFPINKKFDWPLIEDKKGDLIDLSKIMPPDKKTAFNIYLENLDKGWYGITNLKCGIGFGMKWDIGVFKNLLIWFVYRGFYNSPFYGRTYNIALEPWSAIPGNLDKVIKLKRELTLMPGEKIKTKYSAIVYKANKRIQGFTDENKIIL